MSETCGTRGETDICIYFGCKTEPRRLLGHRREDKIKMDHEDIWCESVDWIWMTQDHVQWQYLSNWIHFKEENVLF